MPTACTLQHHVLNVGQPKLAGLSTINFLAKLDESVITRSPRHLKLSVVLASCVGLRGPRDLFEDRGKSAPSAGRVIGLQIEGKVTLTKTSPD